MMNLVIQKLFDDVHVSSPIKCRILLLIRTHLYMWLIIVHRGFPPADNMPGLRQREEQKEAKKNMMNEASKYDRKYWKKTPKANIEALLASAILHLPVFCLCRRTVCPCSTRARSSQTATAPSEKLAVHVLFPNEWLSEALTLLMTDPSI